MAKEKLSYGLVIDWETSGLLDHKSPFMNYFEGPQGIEIGATLVVLPQIEVLGEFSSRVRFLGTHDGVQYGGPIYEHLSWSVDAEKIHGMKPIDLVKEPTPLMAAEAFVKWVKSAANISDPQKTPIMLCGHNPEGDAYYTRQLLCFAGRENSLRFHYRMIDSFSLGYFVLGAKNSTELFERVSGVKREKHSAMEDSRLTTAALRTIYEICQKNRT